MRTCRARVLRKTTLSPRLVTVTLGGLEVFASTGIPDEYVRVLIPPAGSALVLPEISDDWVVTHPVGEPEPVARVYTVSDHRIVDGVVEIDVDIVIHEGGIGSDWATSCRPGDHVGLVEPHGLYAAPAGVGWQLLVADLTAVPALARILRGLQPGQRAEVVVIVTDAGDEIALPSAADVTITWQQVDRENDIGDALAGAVSGAVMPAADRYVWVAGEARGSRAARKYLRRQLGWPQADFYTCGYWQLDAAKWSRRYAAVADEVMAKSAAVQAVVGADEGAYLDALEDIYESVGL